MWRVKGRSLKWAEGRRPEGPHRRWAALARPGHFSGVHLSFSVTSLFASGLWLAETHSIPSLTEPTQRPLTRDGRGKAGGSRNRSERRSYAPRPHRWGVLSPGHPAEVPGWMKAHRDQNPAFPMPVFPWASHAPGSAVCDETPALTHSNAILREAHFLRCGFLAWIVGAEQPRCHRVVVRTLGLRSAPGPAQGELGRGWPPGGGTRGTEGRVLGWEPPVGSPTWERILRFPSCFQCDDGNSELSSLIPWTLKCTMFSRSLCRPRPDQQTFVKHLRAIRSPLGAGEPKTRHPR